MGIAVVVGILSLAIITLLLPPVLGFFWIVIRIYPQWVTLNLVAAMPIALAFWVAALRSLQRSRAHWLLLLSAVSLLGFVTLMFAAGNLDAKFERAIVANICLTALALLPQVPIAIVAAMLAGLRSAT